MHTDEKKNNNPKTRNTVCTKIAQGANGKEKKKKISRTLSVNISNLLQVKRPEESTNLGGGRPSFVSLVGVRRDRNESLVPKRTVGDEGAGGGASDRPLRRRFAARRTNTRPAGGQADGRYAEIAESGHAARRSQGGRSRPATEHCSVRFSLLFLKKDTEFSL